MTSAGQTRIRDFSKRNTRAATLTICLACIAIYFLPPGDDPNVVFRTAAFVVGPALLVAFALEARSGRHALLRTDILMLAALYGLTLLEFLFPQPSVSHIISSESAATGTQVMLCGFAGIALGRHIVPQRNRTASFKIDGRNLSPGTLFTLFLLCFAIGYFHMFLAVNFNPLEVIRQMTAPRFSQDWARGQFGDWKALLNELGLLIYLLPPIAGLVFARQEEYKSVQKLVIFIILAFTFFYGFSSGTRNIFIIFLLTFAASYLLFKKTLEFWHIALSGAVLTLLALMGTYLMLEFRTVGLGEFSAANATSDTLFVDNNLIVISKLTEVFPNKVDYLGFEVPFQAITKPIPRAIWADKPEGLSFGTEQAFDAQGLTIASTFIGESYMSDGFIGTIIASLLLGALAGWWNRLGHDLDSDFKMLLYVSGFFATALAMRSILQVVPAVLPTLALWLYGKFWLPRKSRSRSVPIRVDMGTKQHANPRSALR